MYIIINIWQNTVPLDPALTLCRLLAAHFRKHSHIHTATQALRANWLSTLLL